MAAAVARAAVVRVGAVVARVTAVATEVVAEPAVHPQACEAGHWAAVGSEAATAAAGSEAEAAWLGGARVVAAARRLALTAGCRLRQALATAALPVARWGQSANPSSSTAGWQVVALMATASEQVVAVATAAWCLPRTSRRRCAERRCGATRGQAQRRSRRRWRHTGRWRDREMPGSEPCRRHRSCALRRPLRRRRQARPRFRPAAPAGRRTTRSRRHTPRG